MKKLFLSAALVLMVLSGFAQTRFWVSAVPSNWNNTANWSATSGGAGGASVPTAANLVTFNGSGGKNGNCILDVAPTVAGITINGYTGIVDLFGNTLTTTAANTFATGTVNNTGIGGSLALNNTTVATTFSGTAVNASVTGTSGNILFNGSLFGGSVNVSKANNTTDNGSGNNTFNGAVTLSNASTGLLLLGNANKDIYNSTLTINVNNTGNVSINAGGATTHQLNGNVVINYNSTGAVTFGQTSGLSSLAAGRTITVGTVGASGTGNLTLARFTASTTAQSLTLSGNTTAQLTIGPSSTFNGTFTSSSPSVLFTSSTFNGVTNVTKTGTSADNSVGGNTFTTATMNNSGAGELNLANTNPDTFNGATVLNNTGTGRIQVGVSSAGNLFAGSLTINHGGTTPSLNCIIARNSGATATINGNLILNQSNADTGSGIIIGNDGQVTVNGNITMTSSAGRGILFGGTGSTGTVTLGNGFTIKEASSGSFSAGLLSLARFTQVGSTAQSFTLSNGTLAVLDQGSVWNGAVNFVAPQIQMNGSTYNSTAYIEKNGATDNNSSGGNTFNGATTIVDSGTGYIAMAINNPDVFNADVTFTNTGSNWLFLAHNVTGTAYNGNISVNNTAGNGIIFSNNTSGSSTLASGKTLQIGALGFSTGELRVRRFTQNGTTPINLTLTGNALFRPGAGTVFGGSINVVTPQLLLEGATYNGVTYLEKNGGGDNFGAGGGTYNGTTTLVDSGSGFLALAQNAPDIFNGDVTITNTGSNWIYMANNVAGNQFNGNIIVNSTSGSGINFSNSTPGFSTQAAGKTITVGSSGFSVGELRFRRFTQIGNAALNITLTGIASFRSGPSVTFNGAVNVVSPQVWLDGTTFNSTVVIEKNGPNDNYGDGGNVFNATTTLTDSGSGYFMSGNNNPDIFNADLTLNNTGSNAIYMGYNTPGSQFNGNIVVNSTSGSGILFSAAGNGSSVLASGKTISVGSSFIAGELRLARFTQTGTGTPQSLTLGGTSTLRVGPASTFNSNVNFVAPGLILDGCTYVGTFTAEKNGASNNTGIGNNVFNTTATLINSGSGILRTNGSNTFNGATTLLNSGSNDILLETNTGSTYNGDLTMTNTGSSFIRMAFNGDSFFNGNLIFNSTGGAGVYFCEGGTPSATLASGKTMSVGATGFTVGDIRFNHFTQLGTTPQNLVLSGTAALRFDNTTTFNAAVDFRAPQLYLNGATYNGVTYLEKTGATDNGSNGGNTFATTATIVNSGSGYLRTNGNNTFNGTTTLNCSGSNYLLLELNTGSIYNGDLIMNNTGSSAVRSSYFGTTSYNGNIVVTSTAGGGVLFCENTSAATLASGKTITTGGAGFSAGVLSLPRFTQLGNTTQTLTLTGASSLIVGPASAFNGNVNFKAPQVFLNGCTYNGTTAIEKTGAVNNDSAGSNIFNGVTTLTNSGSGWLRMARTVVDQFNSDLTLTNTGISLIYMSDQAAGSTYNGNITVNNTLGGGIIFGYNGGSSTLATGKAVSVGGSGFSTGELRLSIFTQNGTTNQTLALTGNALLRSGPASVFNGNVDFRAPQLLLDGAVYNGTAYLEKNGANNNTGVGNNTFAATTNIVNTNSGYLRTNGGNLFNGTTTVTNAGTNDVLLELTTASTYNGDVTFSNTGSSYIRVAFTGVNAFNGNIIVNSLNATGVYFCENAPGFANLAAGKTISVGGIGFLAGELRIQRFTQAGTTAQVLNLTGSAIFRTLASTWNGNLTVTSPSIFLDGAVFAGTSTFTKNGTSADNSNGGNTFTGAASFTNTTTGNFRLANGNGDTFGANATFVQTNGTLAPAYNGTTTLAGDLSVTSGTPIVFGSGAGVFTISGTTSQAISKGGASSPSFVRLVINKSSGAVNLNTDINITSTGTLTSGIINATAANYVNFGIGSTVTGASATSHVDGPVRKTGNNAFTFPTGNAGIYRPIGISNPASGADAFTAQYFKAAQAFGGPTTYASPLVTVSSCEYWILNRVVGTSNVNVTLSWNSPDCSGPYITNTTALRVARFNGTNWVNHGNGGTTGNATAGTIVTSAVVTSFSPFALGSTTIANPLPIELVDFTAEADGAAVQLNWLTASELKNDFFTVQRSSDGTEFAALANIKGAGTSTQSHTYDYRDENPGSGVLYYRLKQTDFDGKSTYSSIVRVVPGEVSVLRVWPNPVAEGSIVKMNYNGYYQIFTASGLLVAKTAKTNQIDTSDLMPGVYILKSDNGLVGRVVVR